MARSHLLGPALLASTLLLGCAPGGGELATDEDTAAADEGLANQDPSKILVYTSNIENLSRSKVDAGDPSICRGDWQDLVYYLASAEHVPDIVLFQQVSGATQLDDKLVARMEEVLGEDYGTIIAERDPAYWGPADCSSKHYQTNAIVYRKSRFSYVDGTKKTWRSQVAEGSSCATASASRYVNVAVKLADHLHPQGKGYAEVAVGSVHWPVVDGCGIANARAADEVMQSYTGAQLYVFGGDANLPELSTPKEPGSGFRPWYRKTNLALGEADNLGYVDPIFSACSSAGSALDRDACLVDNATMRFGSRYDFLFAKYKPKYAAGPVTTSGARTVGFDEAGDAAAALTGEDDASLPYSAHKAVGAYVHW